MTLHTTPTHYPPQKLNVSNISAVSCYWLDFVNHGSHEVKYFIPPCSSNWLDLHYSANACWHNIITSSTLSFLTGRPTTPPPIITTNVWCLAVASSCSSFHSSLGIAGTPGSPHTPFSTYLLVAWMWMKIRPEPFPIYLLTKDFMHKINIFWVHPFGLSELLAKPTMLYLQRLLNEEEETCPEW